jgi:dihydroxyacid dehydratase/phosphogluconate dehydratase
MTSDLKRHSRALSDGIAMVTEGMKSSLVSREVIADSARVDGRAAG